jgi:hypothetical protein
MGDNVGHQLAENTGSQALYRPSCSPIRRLTDDLKVSDDSVWI